MNILHSQRKKKKTPAFQSTITQIKFHFTIQFNYCITDISKIKKKRIQLQSQLVSWAYKNTIFTEWK